MSEAGHPSRLARLYDAALDLPPADRAPFVRSECGADPALAAELLALLALDASVDPLAPLSVLAGPLLAEDIAAAPLAPGRRVGPWRVVDTLGRGGMGTVYRAERADGAWEQAVALKVVNAGPRTSDLERRFLRERQILARLEHPGIARLLDGGLTPRGDPYLVLELVDGSPITAWAAARGLSIEGRLRLFLQVCDAVRYAHQRLVVHRDLKPSNILVTDDGAVRLLDFGIARLLSEDAAGDAPTRTGLLLLTPEYAAPEQVRGEPATVSTDVYALGVVLFELLTGRRPFVGGSLADLVRRSESDPPRPSDMADADTRRVLRGDLDSIVACALRPDPERRYVSVDALADDVRRHLEHRPVQARADTAAYRAGRFVRRHRFGVAASAALLLSVLAGLVTTTWLATIARREAARSEAVRGFLFGLWEGADPESNRGVVPTARELLDRGAGRIDALADTDVRIDMLNTLGFLYGKLGEYDRASAIFEDAVAEARVAFGTDQRTGTALDGLAQNLIATGDLDAAEAVARESLETRIAAGAPDSAIASSWTTLGGALSAQTRFEEALAAHGAALEMDRRTHGPRSLEVAADLNNTGSVARRLGDYARAERDLRESLAIYRQHGGDLHPDVALSLGNLAALLRTVGAFEESEALQEEALSIRRTVFGPDHPDIAISLDQMSLTLADAGRLAEADSLATEALALRERVLGERDPATIMSMNNLATIRFRRGAFAWAADVQARVVRIWRDDPGIRNARTLTALNNLGVMRLRADQLAAADAHLSEVLPLRRRTLGEDHPDVGVTLRWLSELRRRQGRPIAAASAAREALAIFEAALPADHPRVIEARLCIGAAQVAGGQAADAVPLLRTVHEARLETLDPASPQVAESGAWLGAALVLAGAAHEGNALLHDAVSAFNAAGLSDDPTARMARSLLR